MIGTHVAPIEVAPTLVGAEVFRILNVERRCSVPGDWQPEGIAKLWIYNLHYFDDLNAQTASSRRRWHLGLLARWVTENPPGPGEAWEPYPVSRRIVNWVKWSLRGNELPAACPLSLATQARWLDRRLEYHLCGNHLLVNAKALMHAGLYFSGPEAERWRARGLSLVSRELHEQVLPDGGHFERSTMYHAAVLEDLLDLVNLLRAYGQPVPAEWFPLIARMRRWLKLMTHPDGELAFFNDAAFGIAATSTQLDQFATRLTLEAVATPTETVIALIPSGYVRALAGSAYLVCDCAPLGPDYQLGHAHADTLSFELSIAGRRMFVNSGTSQYGIDRERQRQRGTAAHNTVLVDGSDSSEVWAGFRVARRARARLRAAKSTSEGAFIEGSHDGYRRLPGRNECWRRWQLDRRSLRIEDRISGQFHSAEARFHLHPQFSALESGTREVSLLGPEGVRAQVLFEDALWVKLIASTWHPSFGVAVANQCIVARFAASSLVTQVCWASDA